MDARVDVVQPFPTVGLSLKWNSTSDVKTKTFYPLLPSLSCAQDMDKLKNWSADDGAGPSSSGARRATASVTPPTPPSTTAPTSTSGASSTSAATLTSCPSQTTQTTTATASGTAPLRSCSTPTQRGRLSGPMTRSSSSGTSLSARAGPSSFPTAASSADSGLATTESELYKPSAPPCPDNSESSSSGDDYVSAHEDGVPLIRTVTRLRMRLIRLISMLMTTTMTSTMTMFASMLPPYNKVVKALRLRVLSP